VKSGVLFGFNRNQQRRQTNPLNAQPLEKKCGHLCIIIMKAYTQIYDALGDILLLVSKKTQI
jgi:hypothetical protein